MQAHYGVDTLDPALTLRKLWVLLQRLPPGAWSDPTSEASWSIEAYLLAAAVDRMAELSWITATVNSKKGQGPKRPKPVPRPGATVKKKDDGLGSLMSAMKEVTT